MLADCDAVSFFRVMATPSAEVTPSLLRPRLESSRRRGVTQSFPGFKRRNEEAVAVNRNGFNI